MKQISNNLISLVTLLNDGEFHDGTSIGAKLGITRAAVWKLIKKLEQYGVVLTSVKGKGYRLEKPLVLLAENEINANLHHRSVKLVLLEKTSSTNDYLRQYTPGNKQIIACLAEMQDAARGRFSRKWHAPFAENIYLSMLCPFEKDISELSGLSLVVSLAICNAIETILDLGDVSLLVKWPNDILVLGAKLAGSLIEIQAESNGYCQVILGVGLNVNMLQAKKRDIATKWTSLQQIIGDYVDRNVLVSAIIDKIIDYLEKFSAVGLGGFLAEWRGRDCLLDKNIIINSRGSEVAGKYVGINESGHLKLKQNQKIVSYSSGDATINKE